MEEFSQSQSENLEKVRVLKDALDMLEYGHIGNSMDYLWKTDAKDLITDLLKVAINDSFEFGILGNPGQLMHGDYEHLATALRYRLNNLIPPEYREAANILLRVTAARCEDDGHYSEAREFYKAAGMDEKAQQLENEKDISFEEDNERHSNRNFRPIYPRKNMAVKEVKDQLKDFSILSKEEKQNIIDDVKKRIETELGNY